MISDDGQKDITQSRSWITDLYNNSHN